MIFFNKWPSIGHLDAHLAKSLIVTSNSTVNNSEDTTRIIAVTAEYHDYSMINFPLMLWVKLPVVDRIHP